MRYIFKSGIFSYFGRHIQENLSKPQESKMVVLTLVNIDVKLFETYSILRVLGVQPISHLRVEQDFKKMLASKMFKISLTMILRIFGVSSNSV